MENKYKFKFQLIGLLLITTLFSFAQADTIPNHGFETWTGSGSDYDATYWGDLNSSTGILGVYTVQRATGANVHSGTYAMELYSQTVPVVNEIAPGITATTSINTSTQQIQGGFPINYRPYKFQGWFKYAPVSPDTFSAQVLFFSGTTTGPVIGSATFTASAAAGSYTWFSVLVNYTSAAIPDSAQILLLSSSSSAPKNGSKAFVDDLDFVNCTSMAVSATPSSTTCTLSTGSAVAVASGGAGPYTYLWSTSDTAHALSSLAAASYTVVATDTNGCSASASTVVGSINQTFSLGLSTTNSSCVAATGTATSAPSGGAGSYQYLWSYNSSTTATISSLSPGSYNITVTDADGCSTTGAASVGTASGPAATDTVTNVACYGASTGVVAVTVTGGTIPLTYAWSIQTTDTTNLTGVAAGNYILTVSDANSCSFTISASVSQPASALQLADSTVAPPCHGDSSGAVYLQVSGGTPGYTYTWNTTATTQNITGVPAGTYSVAVLDANQCSLTGSATVNQPNVLTVTPGVINATSQSANDGSAWVDISGGTPPYSLLWITSATYDTIVQLAPDTYSITVTDSAGCSATVNAIVGITTGINTINTPLVKIYPNPANTQVTIQTGIDSKYTFIIYSTDGQVVSQVSLSGSKTSVDLQGLSAGFYTFGLRDLNTGAIQYGKLEIQR